MHPLFCTLYRREAHSLASTRRKVPPWSLYVSGRVFEDGKCRGNAGNVVRDVRRSKRSGKP